MKNDTDTIIDRLIAAGWTLEVGRKSAAAVGHPTHGWTYAKATDGTVVVPGSGDTVAEAVANLKDQIDRLPTA